METELIEKPAATVIVEYSQTSKALAELKARLGNVAYDVSTGKGMDIAKKDRAEVRGLRTALEAKRVELKAPALERSRLIDAEAKALTAELVALETPIDQQIKAEEARKAVEKAAKEQAERERTAAVQARIDEMRHILVTAAGLSSAGIQSQIDGLDAFEVTLEAFGERAGEAAQAKAQTMARLREMHAAAVAHEAEQVRMAAERAEQEARDKAERKRIEAEWKAEADRLAAERKKFKEEQAAARAEAKKLEDADRARRAEEDRKARDARAVEDKRIADARAALEAWQRAIREADEAKAAAARKAEQDRLDDIARQEREAAAAEQKRLDDEAAARRAEAERADAEARAEMQRKGEERERKEAARQKLRDAAPALLAALKRLRAAVFDEEVDAACAEADEAIALATGDE